MSTDNENRSEQDLFNAVRDALNESVKETVIAGYKKNVTDPTETLLLELNTNHVDRKPSVMAAALLRLIQIHHDMLMLMVESGIIEASTVNLISKLMRFDFYVVEANPNDPSDE